VAHLYSLYDAVESTRVNSVPIQVEPWKVCDTGAAWPQPLQLILGARLLRFDGRLILLLAVVGFAVAMMTYWSDGRPVVWRALGVPAFVPEFADTHGITSAWECSRNGYNVLRQNPCDSFNRPMNYPRLWTLPGRLGLGQGSTVGVALVFAAAFITALLVLTGPLTAGPTVVYALALASPSVLLAVERGNNDLLIFALVAGAVAMLSRQRPVGAAVALFAATALKLYPIVAIGALRDMRHRLMLLLAAGVYFLASYADLALIRKGTPRLGADWIYGLKPNATALLPGIPGPWATGLLAVVGAAAALLLARRFRVETTQPRTEAAFTAGASIYVATYVLGPSWDYRLIYLLLILPLAIEMARSRRPALLVVTLLVLWLSRESGSPLFIADQLLQYVLAVACAALLLGPVVPGSAARQA
jgi:hypothetical protein